MLIRKVGSRIVHRGWIPHDLYETSGKPTQCGQSGWHNVWKIVVKMRGSFGFRKCKKCFPADAGGKEER